MPKHNRQNTLNICSSLSVIPQSVVVLNTEKYMLMDLKHFHGFAHIMPNFCNFSFVLYLNFQ